jgi:hypothetical protein
MFERWLYIGSAVFLGASLVLTVCRRGFFANIAFTVELVLVFASALFGRGAV